MQRSNNCEYSHVSECRSELQLSTINESLRSSDRILIVTVATKFVFHGLAFARQRLAADNRSAWGPEKLDETIAIPSPDNNCIRSVRNTMYGVRYRHALTSSASSQWRIPAVQHGIKLRPAQPPTRLSKISRTYTV